MRWPLRYQIMLPMAAVMLLSVVAVGGAGAWLAVRGTQARIASQIGDVAELVAESNFPLTSAVLRQMKALSGAELVVADEVGRVQAASGSFGNLPPELASRVSPRRTNIAQEQRTTLGGGSYFHTVVPLAPNRESGRAKLHIFYPEDDYRRAWQRAVVPSIGFVVVALPAVILLAFLSGSRIAGRVDRLRQQVGRIARGDFQQLPLPDRDDEIRSLAADVNQMATMLADYAEEVRRTERLRTLAHLGGGIAHQLRNSATGCAMAVDLHAADCPLGAHDDSLAVAKQQLRLMEQYLQRFLQLGKENQSRQSESVDVTALINDLLPLVRPAARHAGVTLDWLSGTDASIVHGNSGRLGQLVINLLVNAIEAAAVERVQSGAPALVRIELQRHDTDQLTIRVADSGRGPAEHVQDKLFEPFITEKPDGVGLGLSVAREVAEQHGGRIAWCRSDGMTCFTVELPCESMESCGVEAVGCR